MRLTDQVAIVTGAASGFGAEIARLFASEGAMVAVADLNRAGAHAVAAQSGSAALAFECDVSRRADVDALVAACVHEFGPPDIVVFVAEPLPPRERLLSLDETSLDRAFAHAVKALFHLAHGVAPLMQPRRRGTLLSIGTDAAAHRLTRSLALEFGAAGLRFNAIHPADAATTPLGRPVRPHDVAAAALYLASEEAAFITGMVLPVDGGCSV